MLRSTRLATGAGRLHAWVSPGPAGPDPPSVVLVHGVVSSRYLLPTAHRLAPAFRVLVPDLPGFGASPRPGRPLDVGGLAEALDGAMGAWGARCPTVVGHSIGAEVVVELARRRPGAVGRAVLVGPTGDPRVRRVLGLWWRWWANAPGEPLAFHRLALAEARSVGPGRMWRTMQLALDDPTTPKLEGLGLPTLLVRGEHDRVAPQRWLEQLADMVPQSELAVIPGAAHTVVHHAPIQLARLVSRFAGVDGR